MAPSASAAASAAASASAVAGQAVAPESAASAPADAASAPYGEAVAARFPEPAVRYNTPAFREGNTGYTTNAELQAHLRGLMRMPESGGQAGVTLLSLGVSQTGVPIEALLFNRGSDITPAGLQRSGRPTVLLIGQQHGDEPAGAEALLAVATSLAQGPLQSVLERINVIVLPRANPDGAMAQRRVSANGTDVNRDHLLLKTPEALAQARLVRLYQPLVVVDAHEYTVVGRYLQKFGAVQRFDALIQYAMTANLPEFITKASEEWFRLPMVESLKAQGLTSEWYYTTSTSLTDRKVSMGGTQPDTGRNVNGLKNAVSFLIETRGVGIGRLHLVRRVHTHVVAISSVLQSAAERAADLAKLRGFVDNEVSALACQGDMVVQAGPTPTEYTLLMLDPVTGADKPVAVSWDSSLALNIQATRPRPCGYWLAPEQVDAVRRLRDLGVTVQQIDETGVVRGELYAETSREVSVRQDVRGTIADAAGIVRIKVGMVPALLDLPAGSWYVPLDQPLGNLVVAAMEPDTQNSYFSHGIVSDVTRQARVLARPRLRTSAVQ